MVNKIRRFLIILNVMLCILLVVLWAITDHIGISILAMFTAALWAVSLYLFDKYEREKNEYD